MKQDILNNTNRYYSEKIEKFGSTSRGVDWNSEESQRLRFEQLSNLLKNDKGEFGICDYGCGYGLYSEYLRECGFECKYEGLDISEKMIQAAREKYGQKENVNFFNTAQLEKNYDYIVASGIFNVRQEVSDNDWKEYMLEVIHQFDKCSRKGFAFNSLTKYSDLEYMKDYLYYADPLFFFDYCKNNFSRNVALLHDYELYEFTILVRK